MGPGKNIDLIIGNGLKWAPFKMEFQEPEKVHIWITGYIHQYSKIREVILIFKT